MKVTILGSGTSAGVPVLGCTCKVCQSGSPIDQRTRASIHIELQSGHSILIDTAPELRLQMLRAGLSRADAVLYTHMHADHTQGFDDLRAFYFQTRQSVKTYVPACYVDEMKTRFQYAFVETGYYGTKPQIDLQPFQGDQPFEVCGERVDPVVLPHGNVQSFAFRLGNFAYATDFKYFPEEALELWRGKVEVMVASGIHFGKHPTHSVVPETIELFSKLGVKRGYLSHLSHDVDARQDASRLPEFVQFTHDSMVIDLND